MQQKSIPAMLCLASAAAVCMAFSLNADVVVENRRFRLVIGDDAVTRSLVVKATGEELLDNGEGLPFFSAVQDRPFDNELKLEFPNKRTVYQANRVRRTGDRLVVGFEQECYEAIVRVKATDDYAAFTLEGFSVPEGSPYKWLKMDSPAVAEFRIARLPVRPRANFGEWLNAVWDEKGCVALLGLNPETVIDSETRSGVRVLHADACRDVKLAGTGAALVVDASPDGLLDGIDALERDFDMPRGVQSRRSDKLNASIYWANDVVPTNVDEHIAFARKGGFRMMLLYYLSVTDSRGHPPYSTLPDYDWRPEFPNGERDVAAMLAKIKAAGITPGIHTLQTHVGFKSRYVTPVADPRLNLKRRFTLAKPLPRGKGGSADLFVFENPEGSPMFDGCRILQFGGEMISYAGYSTERPWRFTGIGRGHLDTLPQEHPTGQIGGVLDVSEFGARSCYIDQRTDLQDEVAEKFARIWNCGFEFAYFDGSEGVNAPCGVYVSLAQHRMVRKFAKPPLFIEGAAKSHFGWHLQAGANAFDMFGPGEFKERIVRHPLAEAPQMRRDFTRVDFGWWGISQPGEVDIRTKRAEIGTQPDMWEYGTSKAAAWDCPATIKIYGIAATKRHPRCDDLFETIRRWEDVRARHWLTQEQKEMLKDPSREFHLYLNERGDYELLEWKQLSVAGGKSTHARAFVFERLGKRVVAYWHTCGTGVIELRDGTRLEAGPVRYWSTSLPMADVERAFAEASLKDIAAVDALLTADNAEVVVAPDASPVTVFAAEEMTNFLSRVLGGAVPLARAPSDGRVSVIVGDNAWSRAAGVDPKSLPRDSYVVKTAGSRVYIAGVDRPDIDWAEAVKTPKDCERATLFGVYGWLQDKAGVRFIWPDDELGTIVPSMQSIALVNGVQTVVPDFTQRNPYFHGDGKLRPWPCKKYAGRSPKGMLWMRHRLSTFEIPCCHGSCHFQYVQRFAGSHPEFLSRLKDGSVHTNLQHYGESQLCWTNPGFRETLYQDVKAYLTGLPPETRGLKRWGQNCKYGKYVDIMPDDGFRGCFCPDCQAVLAEGRRKYGKHYATDLLWGVCRDIGLRLIDEGVPGSITMMAYSPYSDVPSFDLPTNVEVMVALRGPWSLVDPVRHESDTRRVSAWARKVGHRVLTWTYPHKYNATAIKGIPCSAPHAWGRYYAAQRDVSVGGFVECEAGSSFYNFLNYYVFSRVMWDSSTDIDALLDEAYRLMFGQGAAEMKTFFELLEQKWTRDVAGHVIETDLGPQTIPPTQKEVWEKIYSHDFRKQLDGLLKTAASKVPSGSLEARRLAVMRREFYDPMAEGLAEYEKLTTDVAACTFDISKGPIDVNVWRVTKKIREPATVKTRVGAELTAGELVFTVDCMEPEMDDVSCPYDESGSEKLYNNNDVEIFLNPSGDRRRIFHFVLCSNGAASVGYIDRKSGKPTAWSLPDGVVWTARRTVAGWAGELRVRRELLADMAPSFPANFCRLRAIKGRKAEMIMWNPFTFLFGDLEHFGTMIVSPNGQM